MKKALCLVLMFILLSVLVACNSFSITIESTKSEILTNVRVVSLSYVYSDIKLVSDKISNNSVRLLVNHIQLTDTSDYVFQGDILTFTVEIEDPDYEFVSLLSIKFNNQLIRANVDNSITSTRDCGNNICIDFPFEINKDVSNYEVQEVKFAKLNSDNGINAIIDSTSDRLVIIDVFQGEIFPYVTISVNNLNEMIEKVSFYIENNEYTIESWDALVSDIAYRYMVIDNFNEDYPYQQSVLGDEFDYFTTNLGGRGQDIGILACGGQISIEITFLSPHFYFKLLDIIYKDTYFYNVGNLIYVNILGNSYFLIEMDKRTLIRPLETSDIVPLE